MARRALPEHVRGLLRKSAYPDGAESIELIETTVSYVLLADEHVYKLRKPVDLGFLDFTTLEKRRLDCEAELRLNARGCPGVYLGVEPVAYLQRHEAFCEKHGFREEAEHYQEAIKLLRMKPSQE